MIKTAILKASGRITTLNSVEVEMFKKQSSDWWSKNSYMLPLLELNELRIPFILDCLNLKNVENKPLKGLKFLDVGFGGGFLSEALARLGGDVTGIDGTKEVIDVAKIHASLNLELVPKLKYVNTLIEDFAGDNIGNFDAVVSSEVIEHVLNQRMFVKYCAQTVKPGGSIIFTTINSTFLAKICYIYLAENILKMLPKGLHSPDNFISPELLKSYLEQENCTNKSVKGFYRVFNEWKWASTLNINYALHAIKNA